MKEKYTSDRTAILAKKKGFKTSDKSYNYRSKDGGIWTTPYKNGQSGKENTWQRCTQSYLQKWLREKHKLHCQITADYYEDGVNWLYQVLWPEKIEIDKEFLKMVDYRNGTGMYGDNGEYSTYEKALEKALYHALTLIK